MISARSVGFASSRNPDRIEHHQAREQSVNNLLPNTEENRAPTKRQAIEEPTGQTTCVNLLTGGLLVRVQPEEPPPKALLINDLQGHPNRSIELPHLKSLI